MCAARGCSHTGLTWIRYGMRMCLYAMDAFRHYGYPHRQIDYRSKKAGLKKLTAKQKRELVTRMEREAAFVPDDYVDRKAYAVILLKRRLRHDGDVDGADFLAEVEGALLVRAVHHVRR